MRKRFEEIAGHPRGLVLVREEADLFRRLQAEDPADHAEPDRLVKLAVDAYRTTDAAGRDRLRAFFAESRYLHWRAGWPAGAATRRLQRTAEAGARLRTDQAAEAELRDACEEALAALALDGSGGDWRDTIVALDALYIAALHAGIDPAPRFRRAEELARTAKGGETTSSKIFAIYLAPERARVMRRSAGTRES